jgi:hypothetical protein
LSLPVAAQEKLVFSAVDSDPSFSPTLVTSSPFYIKIAYRSERPVRFRVDAYRGDTKVEDAAMYNPAPVYAAGSGEALVWITYRNPTRLDALVVTALDDKWKRLSSLRVPVEATWSWEAPHGVPRSAWAARLSAAQQQAVSKPERGGAPSPLFDLVGLAIMLSVPAYLILQAALPLRLKGGWRKAALVPLIGAIPALFHALTGLATGSNVWPLMLILFSFVASLYLVGLIVLNAVTNARRAAQLQAG